MSDTPEERRERCEREVEKDLRKTIAHVLADVHEESVSGAPHTGVPMLRLLARLASLLGNLYLRAEIQTRKVVYLTWALVGLTAALLFFTIYLAQDSYFKHQREHQTRKDQTEPNRSGVEAHPVTVQP